MNDFLNLGQDPKNSRVVVAMSGGVDSSVAAALCKEAGYDVIGVTMQLYDQGDMAKKKGACCAGQDIYDARRVAEQLDFPHYVLDYESLFKQSVIDDFADSYVNGYTPIPCVRCNQTVKFRDLLKTAKDLEADAMVTGHYVKRRVGSDGAELHAAEDESRDQSYFLFTTTQNQLDFLRFPLGDIPKTETRAHARRLGLSIADKPDSQDICFVPNGKYADVVAKLRPGALDPGHIVDHQGNVLGRHQGIIHFTIGQRRGLGISANEPLYVVNINADKKEVTVGPKTMLAKAEIELENINWLGPTEKPGKIYDCDVKIRSTHQPLPAQISLQGENKAKVKLAMPEYGIAPGQACVFYLHGRVLGGGWIVRVKD